MADFTSNGIKINYTDSGGAGAPVLLLHAFPLNAGMWQPQIDSLGDKYRLIAMDFRGFGGSGSGETDSAFSVDDLADDAKALLDELGLDQVVLAGLSMGGYVALALMRKYPERVKALVLADSRAEGDAPEAIAKRTSQQQMVASEGTSGLIKALPGALLGATTQDKKPDVVSQATALMDNSPAGFTGALEAMKTRPDSTELLSTVKVPTLIIVGEEDGVTPPELSRKMHEHITGSQLVVIPEAGHLSNLESPEAFNGALADFLDSL